MVWLSLALGYLLGSVSFSFIFAKLIAGIDIRQHGSGNAGATNTLRILGKRSAITVFILDIVKGMAAVAVGYLLTKNEAVMYAAGFLAIIGHNWPVFFQFRGGKGVATTIGVTALVVFFPAVSVGLLAILLVVITRFVSLGSLVFATGLPVAVWLADKPNAFVWISLGITVLIYVRHFSNIKRLIRGQENRIGKKNMD